VKEMFVEEIVKFVAERLALHESYSTQSNMFEPIAASVLYLAWKAVLDNFGVNFCSEAA
jgi:hypothetical protein